MDDLVVHEDEQGKPLYDVPEGELADEDAPAPVRLLGSYDNVWLSHAGRDRVTDPEQRNAWMGVNGGVAHTFFADGMMVGLWRPVDGRVEIVSTLPPLTKQEQSELDDEIARVEELLPATERCQRAEGCTHSADRSRQQLDSSHRASRTPAPSWPRRTRARRRKIS